MKLNFKFNIYLLADHRDSYQMSDIALGYFNENRINPIYFNNRISLSKFACFILSILMFHEQNIFR